MSETTGIAWTDHTASPYFGCTEVSPGCVYCYSRDLTLRRFAPIMRRAYQKAGYADWETMPLWGDKAVRVLSKSFWTNALKWQNKQDVQNTEREAMDFQLAKSPKIFPSLMDIFDEMPAGVIDQDGNKLTPAEVLFRVMDLIRRTPDLTWQLLTKRIELWRERLENACEYPKGKSASEVWETLKFITDWLNGNPPKNVWLGVSVEDKRRKDRLDLLRRIPARIRFVSFEPLLEDLELSDGDLDGILWAIVGGESGKDRRDCGDDVLISTAKQCHDAGCYVFFKQASAFKPGQRGNIPDEIWSMKEMPE